MRGFVSLDALARPPRPRAAQPTASARDVDAVARVIVSEKDDGTLAERTAIAWVVRNRARARHVSPYALEWPWGAQEGRRPFSSRRPATGAARALAARVLALPQASDPTGGATDFWEPGLQDRFVALGQLYRSDPAAHPRLARFRLYRRSAAAVRAEWIRRGEEIAGHVGAIELWRHRQARRRQPLPSNA